MDPVAFNIYVGTGLANFAAGRAQDAIGWFSRGLDERPGRTWPYRDLAVYHARDGDPDAAREALERFWRHHPRASLAMIGDGVRFMNPPPLARYLEGLRLAGLE